MAYLLQGCLFILAIVFLLAAISKTIYPKQFTIALRISGVPSFFVLPVALFTVAGEMILAMSFLFGVPLSPPLALVGALMMLGLFTYWLIWIYIRKISLRCGCFGKSKSDVSVSNIIRNALFIGLAVLAFFLTRYTTSPVFSPTQWPLSVSLFLVGCFIVLSSRRLYGSIRPYKV